MPQALTEILCTPYESKLAQQWIKVGGICGLAAIVDYVLLIAVPLPDVPSTVCAACFGPLFSIASYGLYQLLVLHRNSVALQIAPVANALAGALITAMLLVQMAVRSGGRGTIDTFLWTKLRRVDLGLDVAWDVYGALGTLLFAWSMLRHPRFGRIFGGIGLLSAGGLAVLNLATFPTPPGNAGLVDLGPLVGLWYAVVSVQMLRSNQWASEQAAHSVK